MELNRYEIAGHGLAATFTEYGAVLVDLRLDGHAPPLVLGMADLADYPAGNSFSMGSTAGRMANRIGNARFTLNGTEYRTDPNFIGRHTLHGGSKGTGKRVWDVLEHGADRIRFGLDLADGEMGFPGAMRVEATFTCAPGATLRVEYRATCEAATLCNFAHHTYWNLDGGEDVSGHVLRVAADRYVPVDGEMIPTGVAPVEGTRFDFREGRAMVADGLMDHNLCLSDGRVALRDVAELRAGDVTMRIATTEAGLQVYDGGTLEPRAEGLMGRPYDKRAGMALEAQCWPDAPNHEGFPSAVLRPGETYAQVTTFAFQKGEKGE